MAPLALLSVSDKTGLVELAQSLVQEFDFELVSSGGTASALKAAGVPVTKVSDYTGAPEILGGRVKTLHPRVHGGILARRDLPEDLQDLEANQIRPIDLVVVNLYPFAQTIAKPGVDLAAAIEQIDIGGPAMLRAAAKNFAHLTVLCNPEQYSNYLAELRQHGGQASLQFRQKSALQAFQHTATYDQTIASYLAQQISPAVTSDASSEADLDLVMPQAFSLIGQQVQSLRYGENPHQSAAWYRTGAKVSGWAAATQMQGKELSYNNLIDLEAARALVAEFPEQPAAVIIKHTNPCGVAQAETLSTAYGRAFAADPTSAFGGIVALNRTIDAPTATALTQTFLECVVAPDWEPEAAAILQTKSKLRVLLLPDLATGEAVTVSMIAGGFLVQAADNRQVTPDQWQVVTQTQPNPEQWADLIFAWRVVKHVKSNAIVVAQAGVTLGVGAGQMNRVGSVEIALTQAGKQAQGAALASDGFFPFADSVRAAAAAGIKAVVQPGGSLRDAESIAAADELGLAMVLTGRRHFWH